MRVVLHGRQGTIELGSFANASAGAAPRFRQAAAEQYLDRFRGNWSLMLQLRRLAAAQLGGFSLNRLDDADIIRMIGRSLADGRMASLLEPVRYAPASAVAPEAPPAPAPSPKASSSSAPAPPPEPSTFPANFDAVAQAAVLKSAADDGTPFCEECERARREQAA